MSMRACACILTTHGSVCERVRVYSPYTVSTTRFSTPCTRPCTALCTTQFTTPCSNHSLPRSLLHPSVIAVYYSLYGVVNCVVNTHFGWCNPKFKTTSKILFSKKIFDFYVYIYVIYIYIHTCDIDMSAGWNDARLKWIFNELDVPCVLLDWHCEIFLVLVDQWRACQNRRVRQREMWAVVHTVGLPTTHIMQECPMLLDQRSEVNPGVPRSSGY